MLLEFGARNFYSFKEGFSVNLRLSSGCPDEISKGKKYTNVLSIKGANASGKTNVLKVLSFLSDFIRFSFNATPNANIPFENYFNSSENTNMYIIFLKNGIEYKYEIELNNKQIISEVVYKKNTLIIERDTKAFTKIAKEYKELDIVKLRDNVSFISMAKQYEVESINLIYELFENISTNVPQYMKAKFIDYSLASKFYYENEVLFNFVKDVLIKSDTGIKDIKINKYENEETSKILYYPSFQYDVGGNYKLLSYWQQSSGVKSLFNQLGAYKTILDSGGILVLDEFDINLHSDLLPALIDFFDNSKKNINDSQFLFTTHNNEIMDNLKKYRVVLVNKDENESYLYRLDETGYTIRNDRSLSSIYSSGKLGGKPKIEL